MSLKGKLLSTLIPVIILPLLLIGALSWLYMREAGIRLLTAQLEQQLEQGEQVMKTVIAQAEGTSELLARHMLVQRYLGLPESTRLAVAYAPLAELFEQHLRIKPHLEKILLMDEHSGVEALIEKDETPFHLASDAQRHLYASAPARKIWLQRDQRLERMYMVVARKIQFRDPVRSGLSDAPEFRGYVLTVARLPLERLAAVQKTGHGMALHLTDASGRVLDVAVTQPGMAQYQRLAQIVMDASMTHVQPFDGPVPFWGGYRRLADDLFVVGVMDASEIEDLTWPLKQSLLIAAIVTGALSALLLIVVLTRWILSPVHEMSWMMETFRTHQRLPDSITDRKDEMGANLRALHELLGGLLSSYERINQLSRFDLLTGLPNRIHFMRELDERLRQGNGHSQVIALIYIDLDGFKRVNDVCGHTAGDTLLKEVAERLEDAVSHLYLRSGHRTSCGDLIARLDGDEFVVMLGGLTQAHQASVAASRLHDALKKPFNLEGREVMLTASMGIALHPVDGDTAEQLIKSADLALYEAKQKSRGGYQFFTAALNLSASRRLDLEQMLRTALKKHEFEMYLQPKVDLLSGWARSFEALVRWNHPDRGLVPPAQFIGVAEESGLIEELGREIIYLSCQALAQLRQRYSDPALKVAINLSPLQLRDPTLIDLIQETTEHFHLSADALEFEMTESVLVDDEDQAYLVVSDLRALGATIALDDFGTGYSSLSYLRKFPFDTVKIDRTFVMELDEDDGAGRMIEAISRLIIDLGKKVVAEGVETASQMAHLKHCGVQLAQGYLFARPLPVDEVICDYRGPVFGNTPE